MPVKKLTQSGAFLRPSNEKWHAKPFTRRQKFFLVSVRFFMVSVVAAGIAMGIVFTTGVMTAAIQSV